MCGIFCVISKHDSNCAENFYKFCADNLKRRGPNHLGSTSLDIGELNFFFAASVLWTQGSLAPTEQPLVDTEGNVLLWNGDILGGPLKDKEKCDSAILLNKLKQSDVLSTFAQIQGPYSFLYLDKKKLELWFGRDPVGKHSLLFSASDDNFLLSSVGSSNISSLKELPAVGIFMLDLKTSHLNNGIILHPWEHQKSNISRITEHSNVSVSEKSVIHHAFQNLTSHFSIESLTNKFEFLETLELSDQDLMNNFMSCEVFSHNIDHLELVLKKSVQTRVETQPEFCSDCIGLDNKCLHAKTAVLFSGGLDSTVLALICNEFVPEDEPIDLFNVAFEKVIRPQEISKKKKNNAPLVQEKTNFNVPDRITGLSSFKEICALCPNRQWNFIEINVSRKELNQFREERILDLIYPLNTVLDDSLGCALWFAASGRGVLNGEPYFSPARILILGMGADELFGGYRRHRNTFSRSGWEALNLELSSEVWNISERNLGRDNRVTSDHGRQPRFPFLDENVIAFLTQLPPWERCWFPNTNPGVGDKLLLRLLAWKLGLRSAALFPKRALQFGSRIADNKEKGNVQCQRLTQ